MERLQGGGVTDDQTALFLVYLGRIATSLEALVHVRPQSEADDQMLTTAQVAEKLQVSEATVLDMRERGDLRGVRIQRRWRFSQAELRRYVDRVDRPGGVVISLGSRPKGAK